jgi:D-glycero-D-manno-heptose 1,7-bisphosphate phosphatase
MLEELAEEHKLNLPGSFMLGDTWKDIEAGRRAGCKTIFLDNGYKDASLSAAADFVVKSLAEAFDIIQKSSQEERHESIPPCSVT